LVVGELEHELPGIGRTAGIQAIIATTPRVLDERLPGLAVAKQILLDVAVDFLEVGLKEKGTVHVIDVLCDGLHTYATFTGRGEDLEYLTVVGQNV